MNNITINLFQAWQTLCAVLLLGLSVAALVTVQHSPARLHLRWLVPTVLCGAVSLALAVQTQFIEQLRPLVAPWLLRAVAHSIPLGQALAVFSMFQVWRTMRLIARKKPSGSPRVWRKAVRLPGGVRQSPPAGAA